MFEVGSISFGGSFECNGIQECRTGGTVWYCDSVVVPDSFFDDAEDSIVELWNVSFGVCDYVVCVGG